MQSGLPKVMHNIGGKPMLAHVINTARELAPDAIHVVIGHGADTIRKAFEAIDLNWVSQPEPLGTGHAVQLALAHINVESKDNPVLVLFGDVPLIRSQTLKLLLAGCRHDDLALLTARPVSPRGLGRIIRNSSGDVVAIVEERDATDEQKKITEVNSGIMAMPARHLTRWLPTLQNNNGQQEFYLTDIVAMAVAEGCCINATQLHDAMQVTGVNDRHQLASLERHYQMEKTESLLDSGVTLRDPSRVDIRGEVSCGRDSVIDCNVVLEGKVCLGKEVEIGANCIIKDAVIGDGVIIRPGTHIEGAVVGDYASVGPMARLRPGTVLAANTRIGNFVETKNANIGKGTKASHLAYLGDVSIGENCNIGAGVIVCNYDGANKHKTTMGNNVFVGSNSVLVAPVELENDAYVAAGSTINSTVPADSLAIARSKQRNITGWKRPVSKR